MKKRLFLLPLMIGGWICFAAHAQKLPSAYPVPLPQTVVEAKQAEKWLTQAKSGFTENKGQFLDLNGNPNEKVKYLLNMPGLNVQLRQTGFSYDTYVLNRGKGDRGRKFHRVDIELAGANPAATITAARSVGASQNVVNERGEFTGIAQYGQVIYRDIYPGIDLEFVAGQVNDKPVEYNFIVRPGADASLIKLRYKGANKMAFNNGKIVMNLSHGKLSEHIPASWLAQTKKPVNVSYKSLDSDLYTFNVPAYDKSKTLVIDPTPNLEWATYYGGSGTDQIRAVDTDAQGNVYVTGYTNSTNNIASGGPYQGSLAGGNDIFIAKLNSAGQRVWATYYGGTAEDLAYGITFHNDQVYVAGRSGSDNLATAGAHQATRGNQLAALIARFDGSTGQRNWATYFGGTNRGGFIQTIRIDASGNIFAFGGSASNFFPETTNNVGDVATPGTFRQTAGSGTSYLVKFNAAGVRQWGTFVAGSEVTSVANSSSGTALELDASGNAYVAGKGTNITYDANLSAGVGEGTVVTTDQGYIAKFSGNDGTRLWGRFYDGAIMDLHLDETNALIHTVGYTTSTSGIASSGAYRSALASVTDGFWTSFDLGGHYVRGTYLGGQNGTTYAWNNSIDNAGNLIILGMSNTTGSELATDCSFQSSPGGGYDNFINKFNITTGQKTWGSYYGGAGNDFNGQTGGIFGNAPGTSNLAITEGNKVLIGAWVQPASDALATVGTHQSAHGGGDFDGVIAKFNSGELPANFAVSASTLSPATQTACILGIPGVVTGNAVGVLTPSGYNAKLFYQWQKSASETGPWQDMPGEVFKDLQPLASQTTTYYRRLVKVNTDYCNQTTVDSSQAASVLINANASPIANADGPQWYVCGPGSNTVALTGNASGGTASYAYQWFEGSTSNGTPLANTGVWTTPAISQATTYTLQVTDAAGCVDIDQVTVVPAVANAGTDQSICQGAGGVQIGTPPVASPSISYVWSSISGAPVSTLSCTTCAQPIANPATATVYRLTVTVQRKGGGTCVSTDDVTVAPVTAPGGTLTFAGTDKTICKNTTVILGGTADATFAYTWTSGQYLSASQAANPLFNAGTAAVNGGAINYTVTAIKNGCAFTDEVKVSVINSRISGQDETVCGPVWSSHMDEDNAPGTTYTWSIVSGDGVVLQTANGNKNGYLKSNSGVTRFRRTVSLNGNSCTADILVQPCTTGPLCAFEIETLSDQACPKVFGAAALKLGTTFGNSADYNFSWSPANLVDNAHASTVNITSTAQATITVTLTNKYDASITCQKSIVINPPGWALPVFGAVDKYTCPGTTIAIGNTPVSGFTYAWTPAAGLNNASIANPSATVSGTTEFRVLITETASGCRNRDTVTVRVSAPVAAAGNDRAVCNGATVTLGSAAPAGTNWVYAWEPSNAAWTNGTGPSDPQPQIQFAAATPQTFTLTVTDPLSGCSATDQVVLRNTVTSGEYAGAALATCQGVPAQLGRAAEPFAQYEWFMVDGVTPATGLSSNTAANPTVLNPAATATYTVKVSFPGCSTPMNDQVTLTVNPVTGLELTDQTVCPAGPIAIGYGATGNPAAPAGATYLWTPATGLSAANGANPTATVTSAITYTVTVTLPSGCIFTDQVKVSPSANAGSDALLCPGESTTIGTTAIAGATYSWTGAGIVGAANVAQPTVKPTVTTTYAVSVTVNGCTTTDQVTVTVNTPANFAITGNTAICEGGVATLSLTGTSPANTTWQWSPVAGVASPNSTSTTVAIASTQTYRLTQTNLSTGCSNYKEVIVVVSPNTIAATVDNVALCEGTSAPLPLNVTSSGSYSYVWSPAVGLSNGFIANPTVTTSSPRTYTVTVTDNASQCQLVRTVNVAINAPEACFAPVTLTGNVFHDANALKDVTVNTTSANPIPTGLYVTLVDSTGTAVKTVPVNGDGTYDFGVTPPGDYSIVLHQTSTGSTVPSLPAGWVNTGENLGAGVGSDDAVSGILTGVTVAGENVTNANFGVQLPPVTTGGTEPTQPNPGGTTTVDLTSHFGLSDVDGTVESITFTEFPENVTTITINGTTYVAPGETPGSGQSVWPAGNLTVPVASLSVVVDPVDGGVQVEIPFFVTDNGGLESNVSTVTADFTIPGVSLSGNVFHDANALTDNTVNTSGPVTTIPSGLYATLVDNTGTAVATVPVNADGSYDFGDVQPGTYSVVLHQTPGGSTTPSLPTGWINTGEHLGANAGSDGTVNGILPAITVTDTDVTNANFGVQQPPVADPKDYLIDQPATDEIITLNGSHVSTGSGTSSPDQLTGTDPEDGTLNGNGKDRTVVITTLPDHGELYYNGVLVTEGQVIPNYDPALTTVKLTGTGYTSITFEYAYQDQAGEQSPPVEYTIRWDKPLPVTLVSFTATARENTVELNWSTSEETNSDRFEIQRSADGKNWAVIGNVKATGESKAIKAYSLADASPLTGENLYRLKMLDLDGSFAYSSIRSLRFESKLESSIFPNPVHSELTLKVTSWKQVKSIRINNLTGLQVYSSGPVQSGKVDVSDLGSGIYILRITHTDGSVHTHKFVHIK